MYWVITKSCEYRIGLYQGCLSIEWMTPMNWRKQTLKYIETVVQQKGHKFDLWPGAFLCGVCVPSPFLCWLSLRVLQLPTAVQKQHIGPHGNSTLAVGVSVSANGCLSPRHGAIHWRPGPGWNPTFTPKQLEGLHCCDGKLIDILTGIKTESTVSLHGVCRNVYLWNCHRED